MNKKNISIIIIIILFGIYFFGMSYTFGGGWKGIGNSIFIIVDLFFSIWIIYRILKRYLGKARMEEMGLLSALLILVLANIPFWILMLLNPY